MFFASTIGVTRAGLIILLLALSSTAVGAPVSAGEISNIAAGNRLKILRSLGSGQNQHAFLVRPRAGGAAQVLKIFQHKGLASEPKVRMELANIAENSARVLRSSHAFTSRFGDILPHAQVAGTGATLQDFVVRGVPLSELGDSVRSFAKAEARAARRLARQVLGGLPITRNMENFLFDQQSGRILSWFDHLSHADLSRHLRVGREKGLAKSPRDFGSAIQWPDGSLVRDRSARAVYLVRAGRRWHIPSEDVFGAMGFRWKNVKKIDAAELDAIPLTRNLETIRGPELPGPRQAHSANARKWHAAVENMLKTAQVVHADPNNSQSTNGSRILTLRAANGRLFRAVWKPGSGERGTIGRYPVGSPFAGDHPYPLGSLYSNEVRASKLAAALGLSFLAPPTVRRTIAGERGCLQLFVENAISAASTPADLPLDRAATEKLRAFDYLIGNADRMAGNLLLRRQGERLLPVGIDHGLTFPRGTTRGLEARPFPTQWIKGHNGPLLASTRELIASISASTVARVLMSLGSEPRQVAHVLRRLERLKRDPSFLEIRRPGTQGAAEMLRRVAEAAKSRSQGLSADVIERINQTIAAAQR